jgi:DNA-directed RNA polymerase subunit RPC12/RpoP
MKQGLAVCPSCDAGLNSALCNTTAPVQCPACESKILIEIFPAFFRTAGPGRTGEAIMEEGVASCFYHEQKKATVHCDACGRFLCALCDCDLNGQHVCPGCLETGRKRQTLSGLDDSRALHRRQALLLAFMPFLLTGIAAIFLALRHWKTPDSLVSPRRWAMPVALTVGILQTLGFGYLIFLAFTG